MSWALVAVLVASAAVLLAEVRLRRRAVLVAQACHELRNALSVIELRARDSALPGIELSLERSRRALEDLAVACRGRRAADRPQPVELARVAAQLAAPFRARVELHVQATVWADRGRLTGALENLLANAAEHGRGEVGLAVRREGGAVRIEVADGGPGLPADVGRLVRRSRLNASARGHGLGIAARVARDIGGHLDHVSRDGRAAVVLDLPEREL